MKYVLHMGATKSQLWKRSGEHWIPAQDTVERGFVWVVTDLAEEGLAEIRAPRLFGRDRQAFLQRQLVARFPDTGYRAVIKSHQDNGIAEVFAPTRFFLVGIDSGARLDAELDACQLPVAGVWSSTLLLAQLAQSQRASPPDLFVVMPREAGLRILFVKNRSPLLTRLTPTANDPKAQFEELTRTQRYLENNQQLPRGGGPYPVLYLGSATDWERVATASGFTVLRAEADRSAKDLGQSVDPILPLFDRVIKSPTGQLADLGRRATYQARRLRKLALGIAVVLLLVGVGRSAANLFAIMGEAADLSRISKDLRHVEAQIAEADKSIQSFHVSPEVVRRAIALDADEVESLPSMESHFRILAKVISADQNLRVRELRWTIVPAGTAPCGGGAETAGGEEPQGKRNIELSFEVVVPEGTGPRERALLVRRVSTLLAQNKEMVVWQDALKNISGGKLASASSSGVGADKLAWCVSLPGQSKVAES